MKVCEKRREGFGCLGFYGEGVVGFLPHGGDDGDVYMGSEEGSV